MTKLIIVLLYLVLIIGIIFVERKNSDEALLWVTLMLCVPVGGVLLYLIFGSTANIRITRFFRNRRYRVPLIEHLEQDTALAIPSDFSFSESDTSVINFNRAYNDSPLVTCDPPQIFTTGRSHYEQLFADIGAARESIHIEFYAIHNDVVGQALMELLTKKANEGVTVFVMCDFIANISSPNKLFRSLRRAGGIVKRLKPYLTHFRSHRKIVVIDGEIGYIGGMNVGKQYADMDKYKTPWRDTQVRITGLAVAMLDHYFLCDWVYALSYSEIRNPALLSKLNPPKAQPRGTVPCQFVVGGADTSKESIKMCYLSMIRSAKRTLRIQSPYFAPDASILDALKTAAASGVHIDIMIPNIKASFFLDPMATYYVGQLLDYGATVYKYKGYIHAKTMIVDDEICCIGSVNMDIRSLRVDDEICGMFYGNDFVKSYSNIFDDDIKSCRIYTFEEFNSRNLWERMQERVYLLFTPIM